MGMLVQILLIAGAGAIAVAASVVMMWASNRSALWNMVFGAALAVAVLAGVLLAALLLSRAAFPH